MDERRRRLKDLVATEGSTFEYAYDFGDGWEIDVAVEAIEPAARAIRYPRLTGGERAAPPEDVGGPGGYEHFLEGMANPDDDEHAELREWIGREFDPEALDIDAINQVLQVEATGRLR